MMTKFFLSSIAALALVSSSVDAFSSSSSGPQQSTHQQRNLVQLQGAISDGGGGDSHNEVSRRQALAMGFVTAASSVPMGVAHAADVDPAKRPFAYRVDSSVPPTLLPLNARQEQATLSGIGKGTGTTKASVVANRVNLNNMMNKGVFGTIGAVQTAMGTNEEEAQKHGKGFATFCALGVPKETTEEDIGLATSLLSIMLKGRGTKAATAMGVTFAPLSTQGALDSFQQSGDLAALSAALIQSGVSEETVNLYKPVLELAKSIGMDFIAMSPEMVDIKTVRGEGLQNVDSERRAKYVLDADGFIALTTDPKFRLYADRSLLKAYEPNGEKDTPGNFFAERILVHETGASAVARYATSRPESLVTFVAPTPDVRFMGGYNGRLSRICQFINQEENKVTEDCVTTILLNPTAEETLSLSRYLRLEIGTAPTNMDYQTKVSDYLWFSKMPKVNMIPRLMNA